MAEDVFCNQCGHGNPPGSNFCSSCGAPLARLRDDPTTVTFIPEAGEGYDEVSVEFGDMPDGMGVLVVKRGPQVGSRFSLDRPLTSAGRHPESDIFLDDITVSRRHAEVRNDGHRLVVADVGSLNGTYLNRERIEAAGLAGGDEVQIGKYRLVFLVGPRGGDA